MSKRVSILGAILLTTGLVYGATLGDAAAQGDMGPLGVENRYPPHLMFLKPACMSPGALPKGRFRPSVSLDYTSLYVNETSDDWSVLMDMEMTTLAVELAYGLLSRLDVWLSVPWFRMDDGFLDWYLEDYHDAFGFPNYNKHERPYDQFAYAISVGGEPWFEADSGRFRLGDSRIGAKLHLMGDEDQGFNAALAYVLKLPTGDAAAGFGSGRFDHGWFVLAQYRFKNLCLHFSPGYVFLSDPDTDGADIAVHDITTLVAGVAAGLGGTLVIKTQLNYYRSPFRDTGIAQLDQDSLELATGFSVGLSRRMHLELSLSEDLTRAAPDFTVHSRWVYRPTTSK